MPMCTKSPPIIASSPQPSYSNNFIGGNYNVANFLCGHVLHYVESTLVTNI
jgi:hypothetical protein